MIVSTLVKTPYETDERGIRKKGRYIERKSDFFGLFLNIDNLTVSAVLRYIFSRILTMLPSGLSGLGMFMIAKTIINDNDVKRWTTSGEKSPFLINCGSVLIVVDMLRKILITFIF